ncbi:MAG TPA: winged helix-turn-helix domain-containing protein [Pyrinomonadaceae bacterium]|nr:winged helix-turn-helix domain-containing protein [Pyrinomonadaceae bacterium]
MADSSKSGVFAFDQFRLDGDNLMLYRDGVEVPIPPKVAKTLAVLVESAGTIISKEEVIDRVWDDSIVEESNLTQYLYLLRKVLGNMPDGRPYIETLRRRGYRFNGEVERIPEEKAQPAPVAKPRPQPDPALAFSGVEREGNVLRLVDWKPSEPARVEPGSPTELLPQGSATTSLPKARSIWPRLALAAGALLFISGITFFLWPKIMPAATIAEEPHRERTVTRLTNGPIPAGATISPDGNLFTYHESDGETSYLYIQQTGQSTRVEIERSTDKYFGGKTFAPDGQSLYYACVSGKTRVASVYRIPVMGGSAVKIIDNIHGNVSISPDGKEIIFTRLNKKTNDTALVIANSDGRAERVFLERKTPTLIGPSPSWSPDGKTIVFNEYQSGERAYGNHRIMIADVATARAAPLSDERWDGITRLIWAPDGSGIAILGTRHNDSNSTRRDQVYFVSYPKGVSHRVTTEGNRNEPDSLGITKKGDILTVPFTRSSQIWVMNGDGNAASATQLTRGAADGRAGLATLPDGRFAYLARTAEEINIMVANADATNTKQIATGLDFVEELRADPQGKFLIFSSPRDGRSRMFRVDIDGSGAQHLTSGVTTDVDSTVSPDGKTLIFDAQGFDNGIENYTLMRMPVEGGDPTVFKKGFILPTFSPDGSLLSCVNLETSELTILSASDGAEIERYKMRPYSVWNYGIPWTPDGSGLVYIVSEKGTSNLWLQPRDGSSPRSLTNFTSGEIYRFAYTRDGSKIYIARGYPSQDAILIKNYR